jgi:hypothetical protein
MTNPCRFRATVEDDDTTRERSLTTYHPTREVARAWANLIMPKVLDGGQVLIFETTEVHVESIGKKS